MPFTLNNFGLRDFAFPVVSALPPVGSGVMTVTDNGDGTGATATITGADTGAAIVVTVGKADGQTGALPFVAGGARTGNGTVPLAVGKGYWWAALSSDGTFRGLVYFASTDGLDAVATRFRRFVCDTIRLLAIPPAQHVYEQSFPNPANVTFPCVLVTVDGVQETEETGLSTADDIGRPAKVMIADRAAKNDVSKLADWELWRQSIDRCFRNQQLSGLRESVKTKIEPYVIIDPNLPQFEYMVSGLVVRAITRERRGVGA